MVNVDFAINVWLSWGMSQGYYTAKQASQKLGVSLSTLYAYVSRGMIRSEPDAIKRRRRYRAEDVDSILARKSDRMKNEGDLANALSWGEPICESELTLIESGDLFYRGQSVTKLAAQASFEEVVDLLWGGYRKAEDVVPVRVDAALTDPMKRFAVAMNFAESQDPRAHDLRPEAVKAAGSRILHTLFSTLVELQPGENFCAGLARAWAPAKRSELEAALILCADHELNVSAFTARCVASAGATPYQVVAAGLSALSGFRHGGYSYRVEALFREAQVLGPEGAIHSYLRRGEEVPGFGHPLYPQGDPRGNQLLKCLEKMPPLCEGLVKAADTLLQEKPNIDFALLSLCHSRNLPASHAVALFALGRCAGWIAHALEQYSTAKLIRPRAKYIGRLPES